jgi:hypothetical protein
VKLEDLLRRIHSNSGNLFHGRSPLSEIFTDLILAHRCRTEAVHTNTIESSVFRWFSSRFTPSRSAATHHSTGVLYGLSSKPLAGQNSKTVHYFLGATIMVTRGTVVSPA